jgi:hypothetical protein
MIMVSEVSPARKVPSYRECLKGGSRKMIQHKALNKEDL